MCIESPSKYVKEAVGHKNRELLGEFRARFTNVMVTGLLLIIEAVRLDLARKYGWSRGLKAQP